MSVIDFVKKCASRTETHWAHKPECHNFCCKVLVQKKEDQDACRPDRHPSVRMVVSTVPECLHRMGFCNLRAVPGSGENFLVRYLVHHMISKKMFF